MFAINRKPRVIGRISKLIISIGTKRGISIVGEPFGVKWVTDFLKLKKKVLMIEGVKNKAANNIDIDGCAVKVYVKLTMPVIFIKTTIKKGAITIFIINKPFFIELNNCFISSMIISSLIEKLFSFIQTKLKKKKIIIIIINNLVINLNFVIQGSKISIMLVRIFSKIS